MRLKACLILLIGLFALPASATPILSIQPPSVSKTVGQIFSIDIGITDVSDLYAWQFDLGFDPSILSANSISEGPFLATGGSTFFIPGTIDNTGGTITLNADSLLTAIGGVNGSGVLATVEFTALSTGTGVINILDVFGNGLFLLDSSGLGIDFTLASGSVEITRATASPVPEPATLLLLGMGLVGVRRWTRRKPAR